jgi:hypothetical protein
MLNQDYTNSTLKIMVILLYSFSNVTTRTITIPPKAVICELQPVTIQPKPSQENQPVETSFLDKVEINKSDLSDEELKRGKDLILDCSDIFSKSDTDVGHTNIVQHRIE